MLFQTGKHTSPKRLCFFACRFTLSFNEADSGTPGHLLAVRVSRSSEKASVSEYFRGDAAAPSEARTQMCPFVVNKLQIVLVLLQTMFCCSRLAETNNLSSVSELTEARGCALPATRGRNASFPIRPFFRLWKTSKRWITSILCYDQPLVFSSSLSRISNRHCRIDLLVMNVFSSNLSRISCTHVRTDLFVGAEFSFSLFRISSRVFKMENGIMVSS